MTNVPREGDCTAVQLNFCTVRRYSAPHCAKAVDDLAEWPPLLEDKDGKLASLLSLHSE